MNRPSRLCDRHRTTIAATGQQHAESRTSTSRRARRRQPGQRRATPRSSVALDDLGHREGQRAVDALDLDQASDPIHVVATDSGPLGQLDLAYVAAYALAEVEALALDRPGRTGMLAHRAERALLHSLDAEGRD